MFNRLFFQVLFFSSILSLTSSCQKSRNQEALDFKHAYFDLKKPGMNPELFAPELVSTDLMEHGSIAISPSGKEIYWSRLTTDFSKAAIWFSEWMNGEWSKPSIASFSSIEFRDVSPVFSYDGQKLYFTSMRPVNGKEGYNLWVTEKNKNSWEDPVPLDTIVNHGRESGCTIDKDGSLYYMSWKMRDYSTCDIYVSEFKNGKYLPRKLIEGKINSDSIETNPFISPDGSYFLFSSQRGKQGFGGFDLYVSFKKEDGTWAEAINLGEQFNSEKNEWFPSVSPDGKYIFFVSGKSGIDHVYWVSSQTISHINH